MTSILDRIYASHSNKLLFFKDGWGDLPRLREMIRRGDQPGAPRSIDVLWGETRETQNAVFRQGAFLSPYSDMPLPRESEQAFFEMVMPRKAMPETPVCIHLAATGDEGFSRRRQFFALPLLKYGIGSVILENPWYGRRRPAGQQKKMLNHFSDLAAMGGAAAEEGRSLLFWLKKQGYKKTGICGVSMGGSIAARVAALEESPVAMIGCLAAHSAGAVFTEGLLSRYLAWDVLDQELGSGEQAREFMREFLDVTNLTRLPAPRKPGASFLVAAKNDGYVPPYSARLLHSHWPGSSMQWLKTGHVGAFLFHRRHFLEAIRDAFTRL
jgi:pimeloyl-ACP methyl ester carboxylesterase